MPTLMANLWLGTGAVLIAGLLVVSALLPRPSAEYAISSLPFQVGSPTQKASAHAPIAREGTPDEQPGPAPDARPEAPPNPDANAPRPQPGAGSSPSKSAESSAPSDNQQNSAAPNGQSQQPSSQGQPSPDAAASDSRSGDDASKSVPSRDAAKSAEPAKSPEPSQSQPDHSQPEPTKSPDAPSRPAPKSDFAKGLDALQQKHPTDQLSKAEPEPTKPDSAKTNPASDASSPEPSPPDPESLPAAPPPLAPGISSLGDLAKWIFYGLVILAAAFVAWRSRLVLLGILREFLSFWQNLFLGLWGRSAPRSVAAATADEIEFPPVPFSSFTDPFASGTAARYSATDLVCYSFAAFEAWSREHGCPRDPQQTPHELATRVAAHHQFLRAEARSAAELYARAAYARGELPPGSGEQMRALWQKMGSAAASTPHDSPLD